MTNEAPKYFIEFKKEMNERFDGIDRRFERVEQKLDTHTEAIGDLMVKVTGIEDLLHKNRKDTLHLAARTGRLEKKVFGSVQAA